MQWDDVIEQEAVKAPMMENRLENMMEIWHLFVSCIHLRSITVLKPHRSDVFICHHFVIHVLEYKLQQTSKSHAS